MISRADETQEQKRQRLREAGRRKLEEFKLRNVESLPSLPQLGTRSFSGAGLSPLTGLPMAAMAAVARGGGIASMDMTDLSRALPGSGGSAARGSTREPSDGSVGRGSVLRMAASSDALHDPALSTGYAAQRGANGHHNESAPVSRASSTNSAPVQGSPRIRPMHRPIQTPPKTPQAANGSGEGLPLLTLEQANGSAEHAAGLADHGVDNPLVLMLLQQVKTMKDEKQELLRVIEELRAENGNLQELVGFLTENSELAPHPDELQDGFGSYPSHEYGSDVYVPDDEDAINLAEHYPYDNNEAAHVLHE